MEIDTGCYCAKAFDLHVAKLLKHCSQRVCLLRLLRSQGLSTGQLSVVFTGLIVSCLLYALPTWGVFASAADLSKIHALLKRASKRSFYRAMLCIRGTSHGPVSARPSVRHKSEFY